MANGFSAGDLTLSIGTTASETLKVLDAVIGRLDLIEKGLGGIKGNSSYIRKSSRTPKSSGFGLAKFGVSVYMLRKMGRFMGDLVQAGSDYYETLNLWQVAMRGNLDTADQFINKMNKAYGISTKTLMNAQAIFKNMIGSLGQISDATAYALSEALVQMSADFSSLYNVQLEKAFEKMQAMLAGQVRPIRSAGLDMTETTLFMFYQQLGGTKTMRQLNRTEKQLLSILAVYQQMGSAGALGDMTKTLNSFANQSRMMVEYWRELKAWSGLLIKDLLEEWQVLKYINAALITMTEIVKAIAKSRGLGEENFIDGMFESTEATNDAVDELQGKLLDFDKFRSLEGAGASPLAIDEKLLQAITGYSSKIEDAVNEAQLLAETWLKVLGFTEGADGQLEITEQKLADIESKFKSILGITMALSVALLSKKMFKNTWLSVIVATMAYGYVTNEKFAQSVNKLGKAFGTALMPILNAVFQVLPPILDAVTPIIEFFAEFILFLDEAKLLEPILWGIITGFVAFKGLKLLDYLDALLPKFSKWLTTLIEIPKATNKTLLPLEKQKISFQNIAVAIGAMVAAYSLSYSVIDQFDGKTRTIVSSLFILVGAITAATAAWAAFHSTMTMGTALPIILAGAGAAIAGIQGLMPNVDMYATGASDIDSGTLFVAGEMGKTEAVYTGSNGKTNVANIQQMKTAYKEALNEWWRTARNDVPAFEGVSESGLYTMVDGEARRRGKKFVNV